MVSLLLKQSALSPSVVEVQQSIRVLVVGEAGVGKSAISSLLVTKQAPKSSSLKSTAGCSVSVALWEVEEESDGSAGGLGAGGGVGGVGGASALSAWRPGSGSTNGKFFVEIWDVSADPYYSQVCGWP